MTNDEIRIAIAEACGWIALNGQGWEHPDETHRVELAMLPDYPNDLNAMHEVEKVLFTTEHGEKYITNLMIVCLGGTNIDCWEAVFTYTCSTARQRAEAFLKTIGKWKD